MQNLEQLALSKYTLDKAVRGEIEPGKYEVDVYVRVQGTVTVGKDYEANIVASIPALKLLAVALSKLNGVTIASLLREVGNVDEAPVKKEAQDAVNAIKDGSKKTCKGKVTHNLHFTERELA